MGSGPRSKSGSSTTDARHERQSSFHPRYGIRAKRDRGTIVETCLADLGHFQISPTPRGSTPYSAPSTRKRAYLFAQTRVGFRQSVDVSLLDVGGLDAGPLCAGEQGITDLPGQQM